MQPVEQALMRLWSKRSKEGSEYLLVNDIRSYFGEVPKCVGSDDGPIAVHLCNNECALRSVTEDERESGSRTYRIIVSRMQLEPDHLPDLQAVSSSLAQTLSGTDLARALGVENPRPMLDRLPVPVFWNLAPFLAYLNDFSFERVLLASLLDDATVLAAGWSSEQVLENLWYAGSLGRLHQVLDAVQPDERRMLEQELLSLTRPWLDPARCAVVEVAVLETNPPPVLPLCLLASILDGWGSLTPSTLRNFVDGSELGDLFVDVLQEGSSLSGLAEWGRRIAFRADDACRDAIVYLENEVFPSHGEALTEALATVVSAVSGQGESRLVRQLVRLLESDGALLAQGLAVTLRELLGVSDLADSFALPLEKATIDLTTAIASADADEWQRLLDLLRRHQSRGRYEDHVALLEAMITLHRLTGRATLEVGKTSAWGWKEWQQHVDQTYLPLSAQVTEAKSLAVKMPGVFDVSKVVVQAKQALDALARDYAKFYIDNNKGLPQWLREQKYQAGTSRPWMNSDVVEMAVAPLLRDPDIEQVYLIVFDGMSVTNWTMLRDRFIMASGRELFRKYNGTGPEYRAFTYLPSITHLCRRSIFAGASPYTFNHWRYSNDEAALLNRCLDDLKCKPNGWIQSQHYYCYNEKIDSADTQKNELRTLIDTVAPLKAIVFNLQDRLLSKDGFSSLQEIMLTYVQEVALPFLRRIAVQSKTAVVITSDHGFTQYDKKWVIDDIKTDQPGREVMIHNRCLEYQRTSRTKLGSSQSIRIEDAKVWGMPASWTAADLAIGTDSYGWPGRDQSRNNPHSVQGCDHGGLTPEETVVPVAVYITKK